MVRYLNIRKIMELLEMGFRFKCIRPRGEEIEIYKEDGMFHVALDRFRVFPLKKDVEEIAEIIYSSDYYVFSNIDESLDDLIKQHSF